jgi:hypothetical protein
MRLPSPSRKESPGVVSLNQILLAACCGKESIRRLPAKLRARRLLPRQLRWKSELELPPDPRDQTAVLKRPGPSEVQSRLEIRCQIRPNRSPCRPP